MSAEGQPDGSQLSSAADADASEAVAVAHKGIVESEITWSLETSNLANLL